MLVCPGWRELNGQMVQSIFGQRSPIGAMLLWPARAAKPKNVNILAKALRFLIFVYLPDLASTERGADSLQVASFHRPSYPGQETYGKESQ